MGVGEQEDTSLRYDFSEDKLPLNDSKTFIYPLIDHHFISCSPTAIQTTCSPSQQAQDTSPHPVVETKLLTLHPARGGALAQDGTGSPVTCQTPGIFWDPKHQSQRFQRCANSFLSTQKKKCSFSVARDSSSPKPVEWYDSQNPNWGTPSGPRGFQIPKMPQLVVPPVPDNLKGFLSSRPFFPIQWVSVFGIAKLRFSKFSKHSDGGWCSHRMPK